MAKQRKARNKLSKELDTAVPIPLEKIGSNDDPCFGKLNDPRNSTCQRCGDIEICAIAMGQLNHMKRKLVEEKQHFKDIEEKDIQVIPNRKEVKKHVRVMIREIVKRQKKVKKEEVVLNVFGSFAKDGITKPAIIMQIDRVVNKSNHITSEKNHLIWK